MDDANLMRIADQLTGIGNSLDNLVRVLAVMNDNIATAGKLAAQATGRQPERERAVLEFRTLQREDS